MSVKIRSYLSQTLVLLALDWPDAPQHPDFLGFAIKRTPGFRDDRNGLRAGSSWLPNRLSFGAATHVAQTRSVNTDTPSNIAPIQKFSWWDARFDDADREHTFRYDVYPVTGTPDTLTVRTSDRATCSVTLPSHTVDGIGTWFNRAVVSSQAFSRKIAALHLPPGTAPNAQDTLALRGWLANGMEHVFDTILSGASRAVGAVYHLTDPLWALPALSTFGKAHGKDAVAIVYDAHQGKQKGQTATTSPNQMAIDTLEGNVTLLPRDKTHIMHDKFIVSDGPHAAGKPMRLLAGSANFTTEGLTEQANVLHVFDAPPLAALYNERARLLASNPVIAATANAEPGWSDPVTVGSARIRACFSPEPGDARNQIDTIVTAIGKAKHSVMFCLFMPTDATLRQACFDAGDKGLTMFGLVNHISPVKAGGNDKASGQSAPLNASALANMALYHRSQRQRDVIDAAHFTQDTAPDGFLPEWQRFPGAKAPPYTPVIIHHKFVIVDADGNDPVVYTGSANMSKNSERYNDENLLEIRDKRVAAIYLAEFLRLYEHYRARAIALTERNNGTPSTSSRLHLATDGAWARKYYVNGSPEQKSRIELAGDNHS